MKKFWKPLRKRYISYILIGLFFLEPAIFASSQVRAQSNVQEKAETLLNSSNARGGGLKAWGISNFVNDPSVGSTLTSCLTVVPSFQKKILALSKGQTKLDNGLGGANNIVNEVCGSSILDKFKTGDFTGFSKFSTDDLGQQLQGFCSKNSNKETGGNQALKILGDSIPVSDEAARAVAEEAKKIAQATQQNLEQTKVRTECMDSIAQTLNKKTLAKTTEGIVNWIESGNFGNSFYVKNYEDFFKNINTQTLKQTFSGILENGDGEVVDSNKFPFVKSTYKGLVSQENSNFLERAQSTLGDVLSKKNKSSNGASTSKLIEDYNKDFNKGGWDAWFSLTQNPANNPIGFAFLAQEEVQKKQTEKVANVERELKGENFLSSKVCTQERIPATGYSKESIKTEGIIISPDDPNCLKSEVTTPGSIIAERLKGVVNTDVKQLELADSFNKSLDAVFTVASSRMQTGGLDSLSQKKWGDWTAQVKKLSFLEKYNTDSAVAITQDTVNKTKKFNTDLSQVLEDKFNQVKDFATKNPQDIEAEINSWKNDFQNKLGNAYNNYYVSLGGKQLDANTPLKQKADKILDQFGIDLFKAKTSEDLANLYNSMQQQIVADYQSAYALKNPNVITDKNRQYIVRRQSTGYGSYEFDITQDLFDQKIGCTTYPGIVTTEKNYLKELKASIAPTSPVKRILPALAELDLCIPGPTSDWEELSDLRFESLVQFLSDNPLAYNHNAALNSDNNGGYASVGTAISKEIKKQTTINNASVLTKGLLTSTISAMISIAAGSATIPVAGWIIAGVLLITAGIMVIVSAKKKKDAEEDQKAFEFAQDIFPAAAEAVFMQEAKDWTAKQINFLISDYTLYKKEVYKKFSDDNSIPVAKEARPFIYSLSGWAANVTSLLNDYTKDIELAEKNVRELEEIQKQVAAIKKTATDRAIQYNNDNDKTNDVSLTLPASCTQATQCSVPNQATKWGVPVDTISKDSVLSYDRNLNNIQAYRAYDPNAQGGVVSLSAGYPKPKMEIVNKPVLGSNVNSKTKFDFSKNGFVNYPDKSKVYIPLNLNRDVFILQYKIGTNVQKVLPSELVSIETGSDEKGTLEIMQALPVTCSAGQAVKITGYNIWAYKNILGGGYDPINNDNTTVSVPSSFLGAFSNLSVIPSSDPDYVSLTVTCP